MVQLIPEDPLILVIQEDLEDREVQAEVHHQHLHLVLVMETNHQLAHLKEQVVEVHQIIFQILEPAVAEELLDQVQVEVLVSEAQAALEQQQVLQEVLSLIQVAEAEDILKQVIME